MVSVVINSLWLLVSLLPVVVFAEQDPDEDVEACCCNLAINVFCGPDQTVLCLGIVVEGRSAKAHLHSRRVVVR